MSGWRNALAATAGLLALMGSFSSRAVADDEECLGCHAVGADIVELTLGQQIDTEAWTSSIHAEGGFGCADCHGDVGDFPHEDVEAARCATCHEDAQSAFETSVHANVQEFGEESCGKCHGVHDVRAIADPAGRTFSVNQPGTCAGCHADAQVIARSGLDPSIIAAYQGSVHGLELGTDGAQPAVCSDCHGAHDIKHANESESSINPFNLPTTCGKCHGEVAQQYTESVHGVAFSKGRTAAPTCVVCHGIHRIKHVPKEGATAAEAHLVRTTCTACHSSEALMGNAGVSSTQVSSFQTSFHGLVRSRGESQVADCASCHGIHAIFPSSDPRSSVAKENLQATCGECHPGAGVQFATTPVHYVSPTDLADADVGTAVVEWVKRIYWILLFGVLGGMAVHNLIIVGWYVRRNWRRDKASRLRRRFSTSQVIQHAMLVISFFVLVFSGFMLAYPDTWWSRAFVDMGITEEIRRWIHRVAAVVMIIASVIHAYWMLGTSYGRAELKRIAPGLRDVREVIQNMRFHLGQSEHHAAFAKYDYPAKAEYWALVWGTVVMALTGLMLWFPVIATSFLPGWSLKVAEVVHLFEAWLATLAILIFHFFYVFGHPEVYPLNFSMFHGGMREDLAEHHHPGWVEGDGPSPDPGRASKG